MPTETLSVIIPTLNEEKFIGNCIESLLRQTVKPNEIIIVDAKSSDRTVEIAKRYMRDTDKVILSNEACIPYQREIGVRMASGDYILLADADTVFPTDAIEKIMENLKDPGVTAVTVNISPLNPNPITLINCFARNMVTPWMTQRGCSFMFRRGALETDNLFTADGYLPNVDVFALERRLSGKVVKDSRVTVLTDIPIEQQAETVLVLSLLAVAGGYLLYKIFKK